MRVRVAAVVQQVAQRRRQQVGEKQVQVGEIAGGRAGRQQQAMARALPCFGSGFRPAG
jgi:hypothetical protein